MGGTAGAQVISRCIVDTWVRGRWVHRRWVRSEHAHGEQVYREQVHSRQVHSKRVGAQEAAAQWAGRATAHLGHGRQQLVQIEASEVERALEVGEEGAHLDLRQPRRREPEHLQVLARHTVAA